MAYYLYVFSTMHNYLLCVEFFIQEPWINWVCFVFNCLFLHHLNPLIGRHHELHDTSDDMLKNNLITILAKTKNLCTYTFTVVLYIQTALPKESLCPVRLKLFQIDWLNIDYFAIISFLEKGVPLCSMPR